MLENNEVGVVAELVCFLGGLVKQCLRALDRLESQPICLLEVEKAVSKLDWRIGNGRRSGQCEQEEGDGKSHQRIAPDRIEYHKQA